MPSKQVTNVISSPDFWYIIETVRYYAWAVRKMSDASPILAVSIMYPNRKRSKEAQ